MNLKLIASMSVLGLVSCPVFAVTTTTTTTSDTTATQTTTVAPATTTTATVKKHHVRHKAHKIRHHKPMMTREVQQPPMDQVEHIDYKDMGVPQVCVITQSDMIMNGMTQNDGRSLPDRCNPGWFNRVAFSGGINVDIGKWGNRNANIMGENYQRLSLNDAYLNVAAIINDWAKAFASLDYMTATTNNNGFPTAYKNFGAAEYDAAYANNIAGTGNNNVQLEQAYLTISNYNMSPLFLQIGKQFQDFSRYEIHPITESMTQVMSETLATSIKVGFIAEGFNGSIYAFDDPINKFSSAKPTNYGAALGYDHPSDEFGFDLGAAYLYNIIGANNVAYNVVNFTKAADYHSRTGAVAIYGDVNSGPFYVGARYTTAVQRFNVADLPKNGVADLTGGTILGTTLATATGAKPWAAGITGAYGFNIWDKNQNVYLGYQASNEAAGLNLPKSRWLVGYGIDFLPSTSFGLEWDHDNAYSVGRGGSGNNTNLVSLRSSVKFG